MKKILISSWLLVSLGVNAQTDTAAVQLDSVEVQAVALPDSTAIGAPDGKSVSKEIGPAGGQIVSDDGRVELNFPEGALSANTTISIQPIVNLIPNGNGKAYQFEPSGIKFQKPVQLVFHYSDEEAEFCPPEFKFMALQDDKGKWEYMGYDDWDSTTRSLKGSISHFSAFLDGNMMELSTVDTTLKVGKSFHLTLDIVTNPGEDGLPPLSTPERRQANWVVNGGIRFGTIRRNGHDHRAIYTAPNHLPESDAKVVLKINKIIVQDVVQRSRGSARRWVGTTLGVPTTTNLATFTCTVKLYDEYKVTVSQDLKVDGGQMTDTSTFRLRMGTQESVTISDINNQLAKVHFRRTRCRFEHVNASTCVGSINVTGIITANMIAPAVPNGFVGIKIFFKPAPFVFPVMHVPPCGINKASYTTPSFVGPNAQPIWLKFEAKNQKQYISLVKGNSSVVTRPDPEDIIATIEPIRE